MRNRIKQFVYKNNKTLYENFINVYLLLKDFRSREHYRCFGDKNKDKTIYMIRKPDISQSGEGLLSIFTYVMGRIDYADRNGMSPFVDIEIEGKPSRFNKYFELKTDLNKEDVYKSRKVLLSGWNSKPVYPGWCNWINLDHNIEKKKLLDKYITVNQDILEIVDRERELLRPSKCLGLYLRGTIYTALKPSGHPIQPSFEDVRPYIDEYIKDLDRIYLVTEDQIVFQKVKDEYGDIVVTVSDDKQWTDYHGQKEIDEIIDKIGGVEANNIRYLVKILLLAECDSFIGGRTNGSSVACAFNGGRYRNKYVYDVGYYE